MGLFKLSKWLIFGSSALQKVQDRNEVLLKENLVYAGHGGRWERELSGHVCGLLAPTQDLQTAFHVRG